MLLTMLKKWLIPSLAAVFFLTGCSGSGHLAGVLDPRGIVAYEERKLFFDTLALMLIVVLPVIVMSFAFTYHYRASHKGNGDYRPNWSHNVFLETLWWGIPCVIIFILAVMTWQKSHELNPYNKIAGYDQPPLIIQAIALPWKWLFIYPAENIATINYVEIPVGQPVEYWLTTDNVPMSALFIPQLGSQIYAMAGMRTRLNLVANAIGVYEGLNTQYNGAGFSDMHFTVHAVSPQDMQTWIKTVQHAPLHLTPDTYNQLLQPSINDAPHFYAGVDKNLFNSVINLYMNTYGSVHPRKMQADINQPIKSNG